MNIDQEIRDILARSCPVNDNRATPLTNNKPPRKYACDISIVGNNNVVVSSDLLTAGLFLLLNLCWIIYLLH